MTTQRSKLFKLRITAGIMTYLIEPGACRAGWPFSRTAGLLSPAMFDKYLDLEIFLEGLPAILTRLMHALGHSGPVG